MNKVFLRALQMGDLELTHRWHSDQQLYRTLVGPFRYVSLDAEREWIQNRIKFSNTEVNLMICLDGISQPIGLISVREIDLTSKCGHLTGIFIGESQYRGMGYGLQALDLMVKHCFDDLGLQRIWTHILDDNEPSIRTFLRCGFEIEGRLRQHAFKDGQYRDVVLVSLSSERYLSEKERP